MNRNLKLLWLAFAGFCFGNFGQLHAQEADTTISVNRVVEQTQLYLEHYPIEKIHLHFDKPYYSVGDTVWFKAYLNNNLIQYAPSNILYVEVLNSRDSLMQTMMVPLQGQTGKGQLVLDPSFYKQDNYRFRSYTKWMGNFSYDYYFNKIIPVGDVISATMHSNISFEDVSTDRRTRSVVSLQFQDATGNVLANRRVQWEVKSNFVTLDKGRIETDAMGNGRIELNASDQEAWQQGRLFVSLQNTRSTTPFVAEYPLQSAFWDADVQFFPEGGDLLAGVAKKVAFKAIGSDGRGLQVEGEILDEQGQSLTTFSSLHAGMGQFTMYPVAGVSYKARLTFENGRSKTVDLPPVKNSGISLIVHKQDEEQVQTAILANPNYLEQNRGNTYYLLAHSNGFLVYAAQAVLSNESALVNIPVDRLPTGLLQLTLMTDKGVPISERLTFIENLQTLAIDLAFDKASYSPKELVHIDMNVSNNDSTYMGVYSMAVTDQSKVPYDENDEKTILSNFLLTSDLRGYVEQPNYYFNKENEDRLLALDILLMSQGYKRFSYSDLINEVYPEVIFLPEQGVQISGTLRLNNGKPVANGGLLLSIPDQGFRTDVYTDEYGRFTFSNLMFTDSSRVTINARGNDNYRNMVIHIDPTNYPGLDQNVYWADHELNIDLAIQPYLSHSRNIFRTENIIEEVEISAPTAAAKSHREYPSLTGLSMADHQINPERLSGCTNLLICLQSVLTGITYDSQSRLFFIARDYNAGGRIPVQFFIDGMPVDVVSLAAINPQDVVGIDIFLKDELGTVSRIHQNNGVVSIYLKEKPPAGPRMTLREIESMLPKSNVVDLHPLGYLKEYSFYVPKYDTPESRSVKDIRSTVYWNPGIETDDEGKAKFSFYTSDERGVFRVIVEGMDATGNFGRSVFRYEVR